MGSKGVTAMVL